MQGTLYTGGIGNISGTDCAHIPLWITITDGRCRQLLWGVMTGFRCWQVLWEFWESLVVTRVMTVTSSVKMVDLSSDNLSSTLGDKLSDK